MLLRLVAASVGLAACGSRSALDSDGSGGAPSTSTSSSSSGGSPTTGIAECGSASEVIVDEPSSVNALLVDDTYVYWSTSGEPVIRRAAKDGTSPEDFVVLVSASRLAQDAAHLYWTDSTGGRIQRVGKQGGPVSDLVPGAELFAPLEIAVNGSHVYFATFVDPGLVGRVPIEGGEVEILADEQAYPARIALNTSHVYWTNESSFEKSEGELSRQALSGGQVEVLAPGGVAMGLALDATFAYWTTVDLGEIRKLPLAGGSPLLVAADQAAPVDLAVDASYLYWSSHGSRTVSKVGVAGGAPILVSKEIDSPSRLALDEKCIYFITDSAEGSGQIHRIAKGP